MNPERFGLMRFVEGVTAIRFAMHNNFFYGALPMTCEAVRTVYVLQSTKLEILFLVHSQSAVLVSLRSPESQRSHRRAIDDFVCWYCSEPRLSFNKTVITR
jgi:hypothetical protein